MTGRCAPHVWRSDINIYARAQAKVLLRRLALPPPFTQVGAHAPHTRFGFTQSLEYIPSPEANPLPLFPNLCEKRHRLRVRLRNYISFEGRLLSSDGRLEPLAPVDPDELRRGEDFSPGHFWNVAGIDGRELLQRRAQGVEAKMVVMQLSGRRTWP